MSQMYGNAPTGEAPGEDVQSTGMGTDSTRDVAADEARSVAADTKAATQQTAATAKDQAAQVAGEAKMQARQVYDQAKQELGEQVGSQHQRVAGGMTALADELQSLLDGSPQQGMVNDLAQQASERAREVARWLESHEPGEVLDEVKSFARRRPGAFLAVAAVAGLVGGRLTLGLTDAARETTHDTSTGSNYAAAPPTTPLYADEVAVPVSEPAYTHEPSGMSTMPAMGTAPLDDPLDGPLVSGTAGTPSEPYGEERRP